MFNINDIDREKLRANVDAEVRKQKMAGRATFAIMTTIMFVVFLVISILIISSNSQLQIAFGDENSGAFLVMFLPFLGFGLATLFHWIGMFFDTRSAEDQLRERLFSRTLANMMLDQEQLYDKPKRTLSDIGVDHEGELVDLNTQVQDDLPMRRTGRDK